MRILSHSAGTVWLNTIVFKIVYECIICHPVESMSIVAKTKAITEAGIQAQVKNKDGNIPMTIFVAEGHNLSSDIFHKVKDNDLIVLIRQIWN